MGGSSMCADGHKSQSKIIKYGSTGIHFRATPLKSDDFVNASSILHKVLFTDDTNLFLSHKNLYDLQNNLNEDKRHCFSFQ